MNKLYFHQFHLFLCLLICVLFLCGFVKASPILPDDTQRGSVDTGGSPVISDAAEGVNAGVLKKFQTGEAYPDNGDNNNNIDRYNAEKHENVINSPSENVNKEDGSDDVNVASDNVLNNNIQEGKNPVEERDSSAAETQNDVKTSEKFTQDGGHGMSVNRQSAQEKDPLPVDPQEGRAAEPVRNHDITVADNPSQRFDITAVQNQPSANNPNTGMSSNQGAKVHSQDLTDTLKRLGLLNSGHSQDANSVDLKPSPLVNNPDIQSAAGPNNVGPHIQSANYQSNQPLAQRDPVSDASPQSNFKLSESQLSLEPNAAVNDAKNIPKEASVIKDATQNKFAISPNIFHPQANLQASVTENPRPSGTNPQAPGQQSELSGSLLQQQPSFQGQSQENQNPVPHSEESQRAPNRHLSNGALEGTQKDVDVPEEFKVGDNSLEDSDEHDQSQNQYSEDGYLDAPANNLDNDRIMSDKTEEDVNRNNNNYDDSSDPNANLRNKNIIDDNNEEAVYNGDGNIDNKQDVYSHDDKAEDSDDNFDDYDPYSYEEKIDRIDGDEDSLTTSAPGSKKDDWYHSDNGAEDIVNTDKNEDSSDDDFDTVIDEEVEFQRNHIKKPQVDEEDNSLYFSNVDPKIQEGMVEYKLVNNRTSLNAPSSMVLFYTWIILIVLIAVVTLSAFRYRCKGMFANGARNYRNGNFGNYRNGEENKNLLENVYT